MTWRVGDPPAGVEPTRVSRRGGWPRLRLSWVATRIGEPVGSWSASFASDRQASTNARQTEPVPGPTILLARRLARALRHAAVD